MSISYIKFFKTFFLYIEISREASAQHYQKTKKRFKKKFLRNISKPYWRRKKEKYKNMVANDVRISQKMKNKG